MKEISYWLSEAQPEYDQNAKEEQIRKNAPLPNARPPSPMTGQPLRLKDLVPITLNREQKDHSKQKQKPDGDGETVNVNSKCICAVSNKAITTQRVVVILKTGVVMLKDVYDSVVKGKKTNNKETQGSTQSKPAKLICPVTGKKFKEKDVLELQKGKSGFAASGSVVASKYTPTMT